MATWVVIAGASSAKQHCWSRKKEPPKRFLIEIFSIPNRLSFLDDGGNPGYMFAVMMNRIPHYPLNNRTFFTGIGLIMMVGQQQISFRHSIELLQYAFVMLSQGLHNLIQWHVVIALLDHRIDRIVVLFPD